MNRVRETHLTVTPCDLIEAAKKDEGQSAAVGIVNWIRLPPWLETPGKRRELIW